VFSTALVYIIYVSGYIKLNYHIVNTIIGGNNMKFLSDDILLESDLAKELYNNFAKDLPIIDYHCHINPNWILEDKVFSDITELWLSGDHYKWRLMRNCGVDEKYITGDADSFEKFKAFCSCLPLCVGNPIYIWCHMELKTYFGYEGEINADTAKEIYDLTKKILNSPSFSARNIIKKSNVRLLCTTDDPADDLAAHKELAKQDLGFKVLPSFRPDKALNIELPDFCAYIKNLAKVSGIEIKTLDDLTKALENRLEYFAKNGCKVSDHGLTELVYEECSKKEAAAIFKKALKGSKVSDIQAKKFKTFMLLYFAKQYKKYDMAMQLHFNCLRNNNTTMFKKLGPDTGFDCINSSFEPNNLARLLNALASQDCLPKTIVYSLDPNDTRVINSIINCFQGDGIKGKVQSGAAWWFNDTKHGIYDHLSAVSEYSVLGNFIGMLTDSRSLTSYVRHDYFRRILCNFIARAVFAGEYPNNTYNLKKLIQNISYYNIKRYINIED
jgi:glucuronate isomerase